MNTVTLLVQAGLVFINPVTGEKYQVKASAKPQVAPHWVTSSETYKAAFKQGLVYAINYVVPPPTKEEPAKQSEPGFKVGFEPQQNMSLESLMAAGMTFETAQQALSEMGIRKNVVNKGMVPAPLDYPAPETPTATFVPDGQTPPPAVAAKQKKAPSNLSINNNVQS